MTDSDDWRDPVEELAEEFLDRHRRGERPSISEYVERHPQWAERIRKLFPTLLMMEELKSDSQDLRDSAAEAAAPPKPPPERLGDFRILREIGRGGMGVVYEAVQESLGRPVALKVLPETLLSSPQALRRFRHEAQAAARLHHTNIVPVFGIGEHEGQHYYAMQYIEGCSLDRVLSEVRCKAREHEDPTESDLSEGHSHGALRELACDMLSGRFQPTSPAPEENEQDSANLTDDTIELSSVQPEAPPPGPPHNDSQGQPSPIALPDGEPLAPLGPDYWRSVAGIGVQVAGALHYAHKRGVLHRDVKPGNLLLDHQGAAWITDFGLAKFVEHEDLTRSGGTVGTLRYMAPEQLEGDADARSDVYNLGLTLYELLTLRPAFDETSHQRLLRQVSRETPPRPRAVDPQIPRDLETIVLKAIERDPGHRYQMSGELAEDMERFLEDRPIRARRTSALEHAWRWCRRNPAVAGLSATALLLLVALATLASIGYALRTKALSVESQLHAQARSERERAEANLQLAADAFEEVFARIGGVPLPQVLGETTDDVWYESSGQAAVSRRDAAVLQSLLKFYDGFADQNRDSERWQQETARAYRRVGEIEFVLGRLDDAEKALRRARQFYEKLRQTKPEEPDYVIGLAAVHNALGRITAEASRFSESLPHHHEALDLLIGSRRVVSTARGRFELARTCDLIGFQSIRRFRRLAATDREADHAEAQSHFRRALKILDELAAEDPANDDYRLAMAQCYQHLSVASRRRGPRDGDHRAKDNQEGKDCAERAIEILEGLIDDFPDNPHYKRELALVFAFASEPQDVDREVIRSTERLTRGVAMMEKLVDAYPDVPEYRYTLAFCHHARAGVLWQAGQVEQASKHCRQSVALGKVLVKEFPDVLRYRAQLLRALHSLAAIHRHHNQPREARDVLEEVIAIASSFLPVAGRAGPPVHVLVSAYADLAEIQEELNEPHLAEQARQKAREFGPQPSRRPGPFRSGRPEEKPTLDSNPSQP